jgi:hypothetical protein
MGEARVDGVVTDLGERFARALAAKDVPALLEVLHPEVDFRAMTPSRFWEASSAAAVVDDILLGAWFEATDHIDAIDAVESEMVADRIRVGYELRVTNGDGTFTVGQQAYLGVVDERIGWLRVMCAGYRRADQLTG